MSAFGGWIDELIAAPLAMYTGTYTPETEAFADPTVLVPTGFTLMLDRGLDWDSIDPPYAVLLSDELNGVSISVPCHRGDEDHIVVLDADPGFELFGRGEHQEPTRVAFGTMGYEVRDWIVQSATPNNEVQVHVEALTYDPSVYDGAMPHQATGVDPPGTPISTWIIAGTPDAPATDAIDSGTFLIVATDTVTAGTPADPSAEI